MSDKTLWLIPFSTTLNGAFEVFAASREEAEQMVEKKLEDGAVFKYDPGHNPARKCLN